LNAARAFQAVRIKLDWSWDERSIKARGVVAWFLIQLTTQVFPFFEIPNFAVRFVVIALAAGFPIAMVTVCVPVVPVLSFPPPIIPPRWRRKFIRRSSSDRRIKSFLV